MRRSFDQLALKHGVFKIETIGDAFMCCTGYPDPQPDFVARMARFSIDAVNAAHEVLILEEDPSMGAIDIRVGFHVGSAVVSVIGSSRPRLCFFGDMVNTASRMVRGL